MINKSIWIIFIMFLLISFPLSALATKKPSPTSGVEMLPIKEVQEARKTRWLSTLKTLTSFMGVNRRVLCERMGVPTHIQMEGYHYDYPYKSIYYVFDDLGEVSYLCYHHSNLASLTQSDVEDWLGKPARSTTTEEGTHYLYQFKEHPMLLQFKSNILNNISLYPTDF